MTWLLITYLMSSGCHPDGPLPWYLRDDAYEDGRRHVKFCPNRTITSMDSERFRTVEACEGEARRRWDESGYRTASRCTRTR